MSIFYVAKVGCCAGCGFCYGMSLNCHQKPCRCDQKCKCDMTQDGYIPDCERHDDSTDNRTNAEKGFVDD